MLRLWGSLHGAHLYMVWTQLSFPRRQLSLIVAHLTGADCIPVCTPWERCEHSGEILEANILRQLLIAMQTCKGTGRHMCRCHDKSQQMQPAGLLGGLSDGS